MSKTYFALTEDNSNIVIAVVRAKTKPDGIVKKAKKLKKLIALAVKEEWGYEKVEFGGWAYNETMNQMVFDCTVDGGDEEMRAIDLNITALYK